jgi:uncharacterized membrane protein AbrB (regulator of aidB expression)
MPGLGLEVAPGRHAPQHSLATLDAMALLARQTGSVVHVVLAREPGAVEHARAVAKQAGLDVSVDIMARTVRVRFAGAAT